MSEAKKALEQAVSKVAKAYGELLKVAEKHGDDIHKDDYAKAEFYLTETIKKIWEKVDIVRDVAKATSGEFSLDSVKVPETKTITFYTGGQPDLIPALPRVGEFPSQQTLPIDPARMDGRSLAQVIGGRLTRHAKSNLSRPQQSINLDLDGDDDDASEIDLANDVDFIDDK